MEGGSAPPSARPRKVPALRRRDRREPTFARAIAGCAGAIIRHQPAGQPGPRSPELVAGAGGASRDSGIGSRRIDRKSVVEGKVCKCVSLSLGAVNLIKNRRLLKEWDEQNTH